MNFKSFALFLIIFTLGFGGGFLVSGRLTKKSIEEAKTRETAMGFQKDLYRYLKPNENQKALIDSIVADYIPKIKEERAISRLYQKHLRDSMFTQIQKLLDNKQKDGLKKFESEKLIKSPQIKVTKQKDSLNTKGIKSRKEQFESFKQSLSTEQKQALDSILERKPRKIRNPEMNKEIRQYSRLNIVPVLRKYRMDFEDELNDDEKQIISEIREKRKELLKSELLNVGSNETIEKQNALLLEAKKELGSIIIRHKLALEEIAKAIKPEKEQWIKDIDQIKLKYDPDYIPGQMDEFRNNEKNTIDFLLLNGERKVRQRFNQRK